MPGAFDASAQFEYEPLATAEEIQHSGVTALRWLEEVASSESPWPVDLKLIQEIHFRWFETTFPADAGQFRAEMVLNRKGTAVEVEAILPAVQSACENWAWRRERHQPADELELIQFIVAEANTLTVRVYDVHLFIDGNTRGNLASAQLPPDARRPPTTGRSRRPRWLRKRVVGRNRRGSQTTRRSRPRRAGLAGAP